MAGVEGKRSSRLTLVAAVAASLAAMPWLALAAPASAQTTARGQATITIGEILSLRVSPGGGIAVGSEDGSYHELEGAVRLEVVANRSWRLDAARAGSSSRTASSAYPGAPELGLWWRVTSAEEVSAATDYVRAERWPVPVAGGGAGRYEVELDYRWLAGADPASAPGVTLHFTLSPD